MNKQYIFTITHPRLKGLQNVENFSYPHRLIVLLITSVSVKEAIDIALSYFSFLIELNYE